MEPKYFESLYPENARDREIEALVTYIKEGGSCQVIGIPGVGRANILGLLAFNKAVRLRHFPKHHADVHFVMVNFSEVRSRPLLDVMKFLFLSLLTSLRERERMEDYTVVDRLFKDALSYNDELVLTQGLKNAVEYLAVSRKTTLIFLFDRFEEYVPMLTAEFFVNLRALRDKAKYRFSIVFSLARSLEETIEPQLFADFSDFLAGHWLYLPLCDTPSVQFRIGYLEKLTGKHLSEKVKDEMLKLTGGHIRLVKLSMEALLADDLQGTDLSALLLSKQSIRQALLSIWQSLTPAEQQFLQTPKATGADSYLSKVGLLTDGMVQPPLLAAYLPQLGGMKQDIIQYDPTTNTITNGELVLSDSLTKAEFRLLAHLLQQPDRIVDREEIVQTVWGDSKSTAGVTEQAIDQLIFRLRRKIEIDPNNPVHLQTVKGRGVKFVA